MLRFIKRLIIRLRGDHPLEDYIKRGMKIGKNFHNIGGGSLDYSHCWLISIGDNVTLAPGVRLIAHDASTASRIVPNCHTKIGLIRIGNNVFVGANSVVLLNVTIGNNVIIGAGSVVTRDIPDGSVAVGNPARVVSSFDEYARKNQDFFKVKPVFGGDTAVNGDSPMEKKEEQIEILKKEKIGFTHR